MRMLIFVGVLLAVTATVIVGLPRLSNAAGTGLGQSKNLQLMLVLDTTGSMQPVLDGARRDAAQLIEQLHRETHGGELRIGLVAYRDYGEAYLTHQCPMDLPDRLLSCLSGLNTQGGGNVPEAVLEGLQRASHHFTNSPLLGDKVIVLIGDAPGHSESASATASLVRHNAARGIITHTVQWGGHNGTREQWQKLAMQGTGQYVQLNSDQPEVGRIIAELITTR